ncbi:DUF4232 domain-containing protein [Streptomyces sp. NPDC005811]|uniref:DUF4232 domain-containing protein n=1 Tax=Streptomyces sp. NPDC005811 TaxID=3154565 RepID=UPI0034062467
MRAVPITVTALAAALLLTACSSDDSGSDDGGSKASASAGTAAGAACSFDGLGQEVGPVDAAPAAGDTGNVTVTLTNKGAECTLDGFPTVGLSTGGDSVSVPQDPAAQKQKVTVPEQGTVTFTITYVRGESGDKSLAVKTAEFGLPGSEKTESFPWSYGDVSLKSAGKPDASVGSFTQAGD